MRFKILHAPAIITLLHGGLGNQMFQYAAGYSMAKRLSMPLAWADRRQECTRPFLLDQFRLSFGRLSGMAKVRLNAARLGRALGLANPALDWLTELRPPPDRRLFGTRVASGTVVLEGFWQHECYFNDCADELRCEFLFRDPPDPYLQPALAEIANSENAVCVHVRRGDYVTVPKHVERIGTCPPTYYEQAASVLADRVSNPVWFIFSDDIDWASQNLRLPGRSVFNPIADRRSGLDHFRLMCACKHFIIANSTFSWWAAWLGSRENSVVIAPKRWFIHDPDFPIVPERWHKL